MDPDEQPLRRSTRAKKRSPKGEEADAEGDQGLFNMTFATHHTSLENGGRKAGRAAQPPTIETSKQHSKSKAGRKDSKQRFPPTTDPETPAQSIHQDSTNGYQLPSFDNFPIGTAVGFFDDGADDNWEDFAGNVAYYNGTGISSRNRPDHTMAEAVARTFVSRARTAVAAKKNWETFVGTERSIDSAATTETDPNKLELHLQDALDNGLRLAIFEKIAKRLCVEVFREPWTDGPSRTATVGMGLRAAIPSENYETDPDGSVRKWKSGGKSGAIPVFNDDLDASDASSGEVILDETWMDRTE